MGRSWTPASISLVLVIGVTAATYAMPQLPSCGEDESTRVFTTTGALQTYDVPNGASTVLIDALGAAGGNFTEVVIDGEVGAAQGAEYDGGLGAHVVAEVPVIGGETLNVVVGEMGDTGGPGGGGGASAVSTTSNVPLVIAGGGGGAGGTQNGDNAQLGEDGSDGGGASSGDGGTSGHGGMASTAEIHVGGGGGGWLTAGGTSAETGSGEGGHALSGDAAGGAAGFYGGAGGYGGGGGSALPSGGGGGGYGGGGTGYGETNDGAGGGGSFAAAEAVESYFELAGSQDDGEVTICVGPNSTTVPAMPWASIALLAFGLLAAGVAALKRLA